MKFFIKLFLLFNIVGFTLLFGEDGFEYGAVDADQAIVELVADSNGVEAGGTVDLAVRFELDPHWHIYWTNPGDTGMPPSVEWTLPDGVEVGALEFPVPEQIPTSPYVSYGYEGEVFLLAELKVDVGVPVGTELDIGVDLGWLACEDSCVPGSARLGTKLVVVDSSASIDKSGYAEQIAASRGSVPVVVGGHVDYEVIENSVTARFSWSGFGDASSDDVYFYIEQEAVVDSAKEQGVRWVDGDLVLSLPKSEFFDADAISEKLSGILYRPSGFEGAGGAKALYFDSSVAVEEAVPAVEEGDFEQSFGFGKALLFAFLGGVILNLMPCVFPVLSIKIMGFVQQSGEDKGKVLRHGLFFAVGVLFSFWALAGALLALRAGGESLGWGFQLQSPVFVASLLVVMFLFGLSLAGVFEFGTSAIGLAGKVRGDGYAGSFFSGVLATAVATPCTGPFMGPALGVALSMSTIEAMTVFTFLAFGMAGPYLFLSAFPSLIEKLPRPGAWMETFKQAMSFPMFLTCVWLVWLMGAHVGVDGLAFVMFGLVALSVAAWVYGRWSVPHRSKLAQRLGLVVALIIGAFGVYLILPKAGADVAVGTSPHGVPDQYGIVWEEYSPELVESLRKEGTPVFIDFTAKWCLTCKANKQIVFASDEVRQRFEELGVVMVEADWTKRNPVITEALQSYNRSGVPLYVLYKGGAVDAPIVLPQLLKPSIVLDALESVRAN